MDEEGLRSLLSRIAGHDEEAETDLVKALQPRFRGIAFQRGLRGADLEDVVQDGLAAIVKEARADRFGDLSQPSTWLIQILLNKIADYYRSRGKSEALAAKAGADLSYPATSRHHQHVRLEVLQALSRLTPVERFILTSNEVGGVTYKAIAERLGCPEGTVASTKHRAVAKFLAYFRDSGPTQIPGGGDDDV